MKTTPSARKLLGGSLLAVGFALGLLAPHASAQVNYARELSGTENVGLDDSSALLLSTQAPTNFSDPLYASGNAGPYLVISSRTFQEVNSQTGVLMSALDLPEDFLLTSRSLMAFAGLETRYHTMPEPSYFDGPMMFSLDAPRDIVTYKIRLGLTVASQHLSVVGAIPSSLAAASRTTPQLSLIADAKHYMVNVIDGVATETTVMAGLNAASAKYQSYGQDGLLYVLDYGNSRMASFDPNNAFAPVSSFSLNTGITTANVQFGIGINGSFYLADGLGGGSYYDAAGVYQGLFALPEGTVGDPYTGASYVSTDLTGSVYVFDSATGFHQYRDLSVVPEPLTTTLALGTLLGVSLLHRRRRAPRESRGQTQESGRGRAGVNS